MSQWRASAELPVEPVSAAVARRLVNSLLPAWGLARFADDVSLIASELVTNAYLHTPKAGSVEFELVGRPRGVRVSLADGSTIKPVIREMDHSRTSGRGMHLIQALASRWGADEHEGGKRVWVEVGDTHPAWHEAGG